MIFVDTNFFLRFLLQDNKDQYQQAKELFLQSAREEVDLVTSLVVFFEVTWILKRKFEKEVLIKSFFNLLSLNIELEERALLTESLSMYRETNLSLEDCYNFVFAKNKGVTDFKTFDQKLRKVFKSLKN